MADHDDKISDNRRRLFKALSAAPVVMTLRPGEALATSAFQCLTKIPDVDAFVDASESSSFDINCIDDSCELDKVHYIKRFYWAPRTDPDERIFNTGGGCPTMLPDFVYMDGYSMLRDLSNALVSFPYTINNNNGRLVIRDPDSPNNSRRCKSVPRREGYFVIAVETDDRETGANPRVLGVYPEKTAGQFGGNLQGITTSCMISCTTANGCMADG